jgi:hypothetical protein
MKNKKIKEGVKGLKIKKIIFYLSHTDVVLSRGTHRKVWWRSEVQILAKYTFSRFYQTCLVDSPNSRDLPPTSREGYRTSPVPGRFSERFYQLLESSTGLVRYGTSLKRFTDFQRHSPDVYGPSTELVWWTRQIQPHWTPEAFIRLVQCPTGLVRWILPERIFLWWGL